MRIPSPILLMLAALFWGVSGGIGGVLVDRGWDPFVISLYRGAIGLAFIGAWLVTHPHRTELRNRRLWAWSALAGLGVAGNFAFYFLAVEHGSVAVAATLMYCAPVFVFLASFLVGLERPSTFKFLAIALVVVGISLLTGVHRLQSNAIAPAAVAAGLLSGLCYALFIFGFKYASRHGSAPAVLTIAFLVLIALLVAPSDTGQLRQAPTSPDAPLFLALGVLGAGVSFVLYVIGLRTTPPAVASVVAMVEPVAASVFGLAVLGERLSSIQYAGVALILVTVTVLSVITQDHRRPRKWIPSIHRRTGSGHHR
jgi:drug/metabolite transporter (DMT)-like permease